MYIRKDFKVFAPSTDRPAANLQDEPFGRTTKKTQKNIHFFFKIFCTLEKILYLCHR